LLYPIQQAMVAKPVVAFLQICRGFFNEHLSDNIDVARSVDAYHTLRDTFLFFAAPQGNRAWRPLDSTEPSIFIKFLSKALKRFGNTEEIDSIARV